MTYFGILQQGSAQSKDSNLIREAKKKEKKVEKVNIASG